LSHKEPLSSLYTPWVRTVNALPSSHPPAMYFWEGEW
jgi:hypothetical protein